MSSRIRENIKHIFQCFCEVVSPQSAQPEPWILQRFPVSYQEEEVLKSIPIFAYPCEFQKTVVQHFSFVITNVDSKYTFGFCRHDPKTETALVVLSYLPWHEVFYKFLNHIAEIIAHAQKAEELWTFLEDVYQQKVPDPGKSVEIPYDKGQSKFVCLSPKQFQLPSIPENRNLTEYYNAVDAQNMMVIFASMLFERRIIFKSSKLYRLSACVQSANDIIYPMNWQHIFIPVLPAKLKDYLLAPMPYLIGVPTIIYDTVSKSEIGDVVVLDADNNMIETPFQDLESLPSDVVNSLRRHMKNRSALLGNGVSLGFLRSLVQLIGCYREALSFQEGKRITFNGDAFVESRPQSMQPFLKQMLELQIFQQFIEERLEMLNNGLGFSDEFEKEVSIYSEKSSSNLKSQYKEWTYTMKKEGSAFFKTVRNKANPAVKSAVKSVKERGKDVRIAYKEMRSKWRDNAPQDSLAVPSGSNYEKPHSAPTSPTHKRRPMTVAIPKKNLTASQSYRKPVSRPSKSTVIDRTRPYNALTPELSSPEAAADSLVAAPSLQLPPMNMDLLGELKDVIYPNTSLMEDSPPVDRSLKPARRLETFQSSSYGGSGTDSWWLTAPTSPAPPPPVAPLRARHSVLARTNPALKPDSQGFVVKEFKPLATQQVSSTTTILDSSPRKSATSQFAHSSHTLTNSPADLLPSPGKSTHLSSSFPSQFSPDFPFDSRDLFGATPFVVTGGGSVDGDSVFVVSSPSSIDMVKLPPPTHQGGRSSKQLDGPDLIRLDSTPDDEFDPILSKDKPSSSGTAQSLPINLSVDQGMTNPLYPYFLPTMGSTSRPSTRPPCYDQDSALLRDYGIDFKSMSLQSSANALRASISPAPLKPTQSSATAMQNLFGDVKKSTQQKQWTKFE